MRLALIRRRSRIPALESDCMAFPFFRTCITSPGGRWGVVVGVAVLPLLMYSLATLVMDRPRHGVVVTAHTALPGSGMQGMAPAQASLIEVDTRAEAQPLMATLAPGYSVLRANELLRYDVVQGPPEHSLASPVLWMLLLTALGVGSAWWLGRRWQLFPGDARFAQTLPSSQAAIAPALSFRSAGALGDSSGRIPQESSLAAFHRLADAMPQLVSIMRANSDRTYVNQRWADFTGVQRQDLLHQQWSRFVHPDDMPKVTQLWIQAVRSLKASEFEYRLLRADGQYRWMLGRAVPLQVEATQAGEWLVTSTDIDELKTASVQLEKSIAMKRLAGRVARLGGWTIELPDHVLTWSDENCLIHDAPPGYQPSLEEGINCFLPEHRGLVKQYVQACLTDGAPYDFVLPKHTLAGRLIWVRSIGEAVRDASGQIIRIQGAFQDVTEQKEAEARTRALEVQLTATMEGITDGFYLLDAHWNFTYLNATAERMFKRPREALLGQSVWSVFPEKVGTSTEAEFRQTVGEQRTRQFEVFFAPLATWFDVRCYPMGTGIAVYLQDITQRRAEQSQLRLLQTAVARLNDTVVIAEAATGSAAGGTMPVVFANQAFERCTGFLRDDILGDDFAQMLQRQLSAAEWARVSHAMARRQPVRVEVAMTSKAGVEIWLEVDITPFADDSGFFTHWVAVNRDVTERRKDQQEILNLNRELESRVELRTAQLARANQELESFAYAVSHDLRSPLNTIAGFIELLLRADGAHVSPKGHHYLGRIAAGAHQMGDLIAGLLTLAHLSRDEPQLEAVDLSAMAERLALHGQRQQPGRAAEVRIQPGLRVQGDPRLLEVVLHHLLDNAWKFSARQSVTHIEVGGERGPTGDPVFFVKDNGTGFDMAFQHKLFGTFERLHAPGEFTGTGIGLATAKRVVESHGGRIWAHSQVGQGAVFYFTLGEATGA